MSVAEAQAPELRVLRLLTQFLARLLQYTEFGGVCTVSARPLWLRSRN